MSQASTGTLTFLSCRCTGSLTGELLGFPPELETSSLGTAVLAWASEGWAVLLLLLLVVSSLWGRRTGETSPGTERLQTACSEAGEDRQAGSSTVSVWVREGLMNDQ